MLPKRFPKQVNYYLDKFRILLYSGRRKKLNSILYIYIHFTSRKNIDKKNTDKQNYTIARYQYTGKYLGV